MDLRVGRQAAISATTDLARVASGARYGLSHNHTSCEDNDERKGQQLHVVGRDEAVC